MSYKHCTRSETVWEQLYWAAKIGQRNR